MTLSPGQRLGPYEIIAAVGAGGMGEVYRARDTRLDRTVAIKTLPASVARDSSARDRFDREARAISQLDHPAICALHDLGVDGDTAYLVMQFVEGETLAARIARGALAPAEALPLALQIAEALEAAHERGIVHRDLKPANVMIPASGGVKVLDFGLAKTIADPSLAASNTMNSPTVLASTSAGTIIGTAAYMSPEQACGRGVDKRADIWAFGCVLYEMLTGRPAFGGDSLAEILAAVVHGEPDWSALPAEVTPAITRLMRRCLRKDPRVRLRDIGEARLVLATPSGLDAEEDRDARPRGSDRHLVLALAGALVIALAAVALLGWPARPPGSTDPMHVSLVFPGGVHLGAPQPSLALSPDGGLLAYTGGSSDGSALWLRAFAEPGPRLLSRGAGRNAVFSPDGEWIATIAGTRLVKTSVRSGADVEVALAAGFPWGVAWTSRDELVFALPDAGLWRVAATGGTPTRVADGRFFYPDAVPGGRHVIVTIEPPDSRTAADLNIAAVDLDTGAVRTLVENGTYGRYAASGHLLYLRDGTLMAVAFDAASADLRGDPAVVLPGVFMNPAVPSGNFAVSPNGTLVYAAGTPADFSRRLVTVGSNQPARPLLEMRDHFSKALMAPDGQRVAVIVRALRDFLSVLDLTRGVLTRISPQGMHVTDAAWSTDGGRLIVTASDGDGPRRLFLLRPVPGAPAEPLTDVESTEGSFTPDGSAAVYTNFGPQRNADLFLVPLTGTRTPRPLLQTRLAEFTPVISPDGRWIAYQSNQSGEFALYVADFPRMEHRVQASTGLPGTPVWSKDSRRLFYRAGRTSRIMAVDVSASPALSLGRPSVYTEIPGGPGGAFDVLEDGRLLAIEGEGVAAGRDELRVILNWFADLQRKAPSRSN